MEICLHNESPARETTLGTGLFSTIVLDRVSEGKVHSLKVVFSVAGCVVDQVTDL